MPDSVNIKIVSNQNEFDDALSVRQKVFVEEQKISPDNEFDNNDFNATHIVAYVNDKPVGTLRIRYFKDFVKFERACVLKEFRKTNVAQAIVQVASKFCALKGYEVAHCICKKELLPRWAKDGAFPIKNADPVIQNGMTLIPIEQKLPETKQKIDWNTPFHVLNLKEGDWFEDEKLPKSYPLTSKESIEHFESLSKKVRILKYEEQVFELNPPIKSPLAKDSDTNSR